MNMHLAVIKSGINARIDRLPYPVEQHGLLGQQPGSMSVGENLWALPSKNVRAPVERVWQAYNTPNSIVQGMWLWKIGM
jgi:hypothetical protein